MKKGNIRINIDLEDVDRQIDKINDNIDEVTKNATSRIASEGRKRARKEIRRYDRIWNKDVLDSWVPIRQRTNAGVHVTGFQNYSDHAGIVDEGANFKNYPNFDNLKEYVRSEYPHVAAQGEQRLNQVTHGLMINLFENGIQGIHFSDAAERRMSDVSERIFTEEHNKL